VSMRLRLFPFAAALAALCLAGDVFAQTGSLSGHVTDADTGDDLIGVDIFLSPSGQAQQSDLDGRFAFTGLAPGTYNLHLAYLGYAEQDVKLLRVTTGKSAPLEIRLEPAEAFATEDMVITAERITATETAVMAERQEAPVIGDAVSAAQVQKSPDASTGDALKRVTGLTVNEGKYVFVRGMSDRYSVTEVNGVSMSGTNVDKDRRSFNFDMVPANLLANITVIKQAAPDLPGDFAGGLVRINTLEFPTESTTTASFTVGASTGTTGRELHQDALRGSHDWWGFDDGGRDLPRATLDSTVLYQTTFRNPDLARALPNRWTSKGRTAPPRVGFSLSHGNKLSLLGADVGYMGAVSYSNRYERKDVSETRRSGDDDSELLGRTDNYRAVLGGLANLFVRRGDHRLGLTNLYNHVADSEVSPRMTQYLQTHTQWQSMAWHERYQFVDKLDGRHRLPGPGGGFDLQWDVAYGESHAAEPDRRYLSYLLPEGEDETPPLMNENMRTWTWVDEFRRGGGADLTWNLRPGDVTAEAEGSSPRLKAGYREDHRSRAFDGQAWYTSATQSPLFNWELSTLGPDSIFDPANYNEVSDPRRGRLWEFVQDTRLSGLYRGQHDLHAWYGLLDLPFRALAEDFRLTGGARVEQSVQTVISTPNRAIPARRDTARVDTRDVLPSLGLVWLPGENSNLRLGYSETLNRPEFQEMSTVLRRDYRTLQNVEGNPYLERTLIRNYDARVETFPAPGAVLAASAFYKRLTNAIEDTLKSETPERPTASFASTPRARCWGFELEANRKLDVVPALRNFTVLANYARIWSEVVYDNPETPATVEHLTRPLQGQAPWALNLSLTFDNDGTGTTANLLLNRIGRRLDKIAVTEYRYIYLEPRTKLDLVVTQRLPWSLKAKLAVADLLAPHTVKTSHKQETLEEYVYSDVQESTAWSLAVSGAF
jgi:outer membrane receptor protein involved in Fe transport